MKVHEKLHHVSIDLPDDFNAHFKLTNKSRHFFYEIMIFRVNFFRIEYFVVRVVFRYENAEVGGGTIF